MHGNQRTSGTRATHVIPRVPDSNCAAADQAQRRPEVVQFELLRRRSGSPSYASVAPALQQEPMDACGEGALRPRRIAVLADDISAGVNRIPKRGGRQDAAFAWRDRAAAERSTFLVYSKWEPRLDALRADARLPKLLSRMGLPT